MSNIYFIVYYCKSGSMTHNSTLHNMMFFYKIIFNYIKIVLYYQITSEESETNEKESLLFFSLCSFAALVYGSLMA